MSQKSQILKHLKSGKTITPMDALKWFGCFRLGARIAELRAEGCSIVTVPEPNINNTGRHARYAMVT